MSNKVPHWVRQGFLDHCDYKEWSGTAGLIISAAPGMAVRFVGYHTLTIENSANPAIVSVLDASAAGSQVYKHTASAGELVGMPLPINTGGIYMQAINASATAGSKYILFFTQYAPKKPVS